MKRQPPLASALLLGLIVPALGGASRAAEAEPSAFVVEPYIQLGDYPAPVGGRERLSVLWHAPDSDTPWSVEYRTSGDAAWRRAEAPTWRRVAVPTIEPHRVYAAVLADLPPGAEVAYRVATAGRPAFAATARARKPAGFPSRAVVYGDCGAGTPEQRAIADAVHQARPDYAVITGDIVYSRGRVSEYREKFFPAYNAAAPSPTAGAPLLRSTLFLAAPGNHDIATRDLEKYPDGLAYFLYWDQPLNGPDNAGGGSPIAPLQGPEPNRQAFRDAAGPNYPRMANFSFDYGDAHWTVLDANGYANWDAPDLRDWIARDLDAARDKPWRFVAFHQPGFNSSLAHFSDQRTRVLAPLFEQGGVSIVFAGHVHNYQRTHPMRFRPDGGADGEDRVDGRWTLDGAYDGRTSTRPDGVIYVITGAGGQRLYNPEQQDDQASWQPFTHRFVSKVHSFTVVDVEPDRVDVRQLSADGAELDRFRLTR
jgi:3',5'-cyclic AMP phosphodiesterase CpdA